MATIPLYSGDRLFCRTKSKSILHKKHHVRAIFKSFVFVVLIIGYSTFSYFGIKNFPVSQKDIHGDHNQQRRYLSTSLPINTSEPESPTPDDLILEDDTHLSFTFDRRLQDCGAVADPKWLLAFYIFGVLYTFLGLAIVCDEFFVPALEEMAGEAHLNLSMDVAGATLMAAGGSAPELFTNFSGTFMESDLGFGTIVGSAVFNVLFVIGMCSMLSKEVLNLTWWPLFRDCVYYVFGLIVLTIFVSKVSSAEQIEWWEALVLLLLYFGYVLLMKYNRKLYTLLTGKIYVGPEDDASEAPPAHIKPEATRETSATITPCTESAPELCSNGENCQESSENDQENNANHVKFDTNTDGQEKGENRGELARELSSKSMGSTTSNRSATLKHYTHGRWPGSFRAGILKLLREPNSWVDTGGVGLVGQIAGDVHEVFNHVDKNGDGSLDKDELGIVFEELGHVLPPDELDKAFDELDLDKDGQISKSEFTKWYVRSEEQVLYKLKETFDKFDEDGNGYIERDELARLLKKLEPRTTEADIDEALKACIKETPDDAISYKEFSDWYVKSILYDRQKEDVDDDVDGVFANLRPPRDSGILQKIVWLIYLPLVAAFSFTIPDVRRDGCQKYCYTSFTLSIGWIAILSLAMVSLTTVIGATVGIPDIVMGYTFIAAGTSVPDLLTSVIVARRGEGDMAISSSIGSNIFDILVGLPLPWLLYSLINWGGRVTMQAENIAIDLGILLGMVASIVLTIHLSGWKLSKRVGIVMFMLYFVFLAQAIGRAVPFTPCSQT